MSSSSSGPLGGLDIRVPLGSFFAIVGAVLAIYGLMTDAATYERSLGHNVNLWWGLVLLVFGVVLLVMSRRKSVTRPADVM